jgi:hypothetical protein
MCHFSWYLLLLHDKEKDDKKDTNHDNNTQCSIGTIPMRNDLPIIPNTNVSQIIDYDDCRGIQWHKRGLVGNVGTLNPFNRMMLFLDSETSRFYSASLLIGMLIVPVVVVMNQKGSS